MRKLQVLFPEPQLRRLREIARNEDRPISELIRIAVDAWLEKSSSSTWTVRGRQMPVFHGGRIRMSSEHLREIAYTDRAETGE